MAKPKPHHSEDGDAVAPLTEDDATTARLDLLSAYTMLGRLERDGLLPSSVEKAAPVVELPAHEEDGYFYKAPGEDAWKAA